MGYLVGKNYLGVTVWCKYLLTCSVECTVIVMSCVRVRLKGSQLNMKGIVAHFISSLSSLVFFILSGFDLDTVEGR